MAEKPRTFASRPIDTASADGPDVDPRQGRLNFGEMDELEAEGTHQGLGHRAAKAPADREHGKKTRQRLKDIVSGRR